MLGRRRGRLAGARRLRVRRRPRQRFDQASRLTLQVGEPAAAPLLYGAQGGLALLERRPRCRQGLPAVCDRSTGRLHPLDRGLHLEDVGARGGAEIADPADHPALIVLDALEVERSRRQVIDALRVEQQRRDVELAASVDRDEQALELVGRAPEPPLRVRKLVARFRQVAPRSRELRFLLGELSGYRVLALAQSRNLPEQGIDGSVLLRELGTDPVLLGAQAVEPRGLGAGGGAVGQPDREGSGEHGQRDHEAVTEWAEVDLRARHAVAGPRGLRHPRP